MAVIQVLSPEDTLMHVAGFVSDYLAMGVLGLPLTVKPADLRE
jgi:hypothetical protein